MEKIDWVTKENFSRLPKEWFYRGLVFKSQRAHQISLMWCSVGTSINNERKLRSRTLYKLALRLGTETIVKSLLNSKNDVAIALNRHCGNILPRIEPTFDPVFESGISYDIISLFR